MSLEAALMGADGVAKPKERKRGRKEPSGAKKRRRRRQGVLHAAGTVGECE